MATDNRCKCVCLAVLDCAIALIACIVVLILLPISAIAGMSR